MNLSRHANLTVVVRLVSEDLFALVMLSMLFLATCNRSKYNKKDDNKVTKTTYNINKWLRMTMLQLKRSSKIITFFVSLNNEKRNSEEKRNRAAPTNKQRRYIFIWRIFYVEAIVTIQWDPGQAGDRITISTDGTRFSTQILFFVLHLKLSISFVPLKFRMMKPPPPQPF